MATPSSSPTPACVSPLDSPTPLCIWRKYIDCCHCSTQRLVYTAYHDEATFSVPDPRKHLLLAHSHADSLLLPPTISSPTPPTSSKCNKCHHPPCAHCNLLTWSYVLICWSCNTSNDVDNLIDGRRCGRCGYMWDGSWVRVGFRWCGGQLEKIGRAHEGGARMTGWGIV